MANEGGSGEQPLEKSQTSDVTDRLYAALGPVGQKYA